MSSALFSDYNYNKFILENINNASIFDLKLKSRIEIWKTQKYKKILDEVELLPE